MSYRLSKHARALSPIASRSAAFSPSHRASSRPMPSAVILLSVDASQTTRIAESIADLAGVTEVYSVAGNFDIVAIVRVATNEELADLVTDRIRPIPGIVNSQTLIAFRTYSPSEVNALFDLG